MKKKSCLIFAFTILPLVAFIIFMLSLKVEEVNPFDYVDIEYFGSIYPDISVEIFENTSPIDEMYFYFKKSDHLVKGEPVILYVGPDNIEKICRDKYGVKLIQLSKEYYLPEDLPEHICSYNQISNEEERDLIDHCRSAILSGTYSSGSDPDTIGTFTPKVTVTPTLCNSMITSSHEIYFVFSCAI